ncbi:hypothetical protein EVAR_881_1 [Eumeta japonica]|uniref:Uncharacterized protein n=1 Tax=Eumeta variegata TaxID=151549 RepID=A0A4C1SFY2_EUMVA|nr:hypothetical protein EVAR_881_1 [Eumeta japonica]
MPSKQWFYKKRPPKRPRSSNGQIKRVKYDHHLILTIWARANNTSSRLLGNLTRLRAHFIIKIRCRRGLKALTRRYTARRSLEIKRLLLGGALSKITPRSLARTCPRRANIKVLKNSRCATNSVKHRPDYGHENKRRPAQIPARPRPAGGHRPRLDSEQDNVRSSVRWVFLFQETVINVYET